MGDIAIWSRVTWMLEITIFDTNGKGMSSFPLRVYQMVRSTNCFKKSDENKLQDPEKTSFFA